MANTVIKTEAIQLKITEIKQAVANNTFQPAMLNELVQVVIDEIPPMVVYLSGPKE